MAFFWKSSDFVKLNSLLQFATVTHEHRHPLRVAWAPQLSRMTVSFLNRMGLISLKRSTLATIHPSTTPEYVIIGFGPAGKAVGQTLHRISERVAVIDLNPGLIDEVQQLGLVGHIGDAMQADVLEHAGVLSASAVVVTVPDPVAAQAIVALIRSIAPEVHVIARTLSPLLGCLAGRRCIGSGGRRTLSWHAFGCSAAALPW